MKIGVLSLQGGVIEHIDHLKHLDTDAVEVKTLNDMKDIDGIILPGGESSTMGKLLRISGLLEPLKNKIIKGLPVWGTCAGMILLAKNIENDPVTHLAVMDITVRRNAFGSQLDSFKTDKLIKDVSGEPVPLVFIRAPFITSADREVKILCSIDDQIVAVRKGSMLATAFHPELTDNLAFHKYFVSICKQYRKREL